LFPTQYSHGFAGTHIVPHFDMRRQEGIRLEHFLKAVAVNLSNSWAAERSRVGAITRRKVVVMRSNLRWCSDGFEFAYWNGDVVRAAFVLDAYEREVIAWRVVAGVGISGSDIRDMMLEALASSSAC
jgi:transposase InsO family protein